MHAYIYIYIYTHIHTHIYTYTSILTANENTFAPQVHEEPRGEEMGPAVEGLP